MTLAEALRGGLRAGRGFDLFYPVWRALTSVRVAIYLLGLVALGALLGTVFPQMPGQMRDIPAARSARLELQRSRYGVFTPLLDRVGSFEVYRTYWYNGLLVLVLVAVAVCTANRFGPTWRGLTRLQTRVPEAYFSRARHRAQRDAPVDADALATALRSHRYLVHRHDEAGTIYLYADRYRWAQLATFVSHLSLILLLAGGIVTKLFGFDCNLLIAEGRTAPVFSVVNDRQMQLEVKRFVEGRDAQGRVTDFRSSVVLYSRGIAVKEGDITVNGPLKWNGYVFHQAARQVNGAELQVRDRRTGQLLYNEVLNLFNGAPAALLPHPAGGRNLLVVLRAQGQPWRMEIFALGGTDPGARRVGADRGIHLHVRRGARRCLGPGHRHPRCPGWRGSPDEQRGRRGRARRRFAHTRHRRRHRLLRARTGDAGELGAGGG